MAEVKPNWRRVEFGGVAHCVSDRVDDPSQAGVDRYVGLEHLDPGSLTIRRWGTPDQVESTKLRFRPGDIIFGKRRAYQRKLAVADFHGICSAHAMVLRAKPEIVLPEFLPFFMQSDIFMDRAQAISVGSLSPTINWKTLAAEEFALPSLAEQRCSVGVLTNANEHRQSCWAAEEAAKIVATSLIEDFIACNTRKIALSEMLADVSYGCSTKSSSEQAGVPILRIPNVLRGKLDLTDLQWLTLSLEDRCKYAVVPGDVLLVRTNGNADYVGRSVTIPEGVGDMVYASYLLRLRVRPDRMVPEFLSAMLNAPTTRRQLRASVRSSAGNYNINVPGVREQVVPACSLEVQATLVEQLRVLHTATTSIEARARSADELLRLLLVRTLS